MSTKQSSFLETKKCDKRTRSIVYEYIRRCQLLLPQNNPYYNIAELIKHLCISYYFTREYFTKHGNNITLNDKQNIAKKSGKHYDTVYGNIDIDGSSPMRYIWTFKIIQIEYEMDIGIDASNKLYCNTWFHNKDKNKSHFYALAEDGRRSAHNTPLYDEHCDENFANGVIIKMELNVPLATLAFFIDNKYQGVAFKDIDFRNKVFNMAIFMGMPDDEIELIDFEQIYCP